jgi:hypothetical protein
LIEPSGQVKGGALAFGILVGLLAAALVYLSYAKSDAAIYDEDDFPDDEADTASEDGRGHATSDRQNFGAGAAVGIVIVFLVSFTSAYALSTRSEAFSRGTARVKQVAGGGSRVQSGGYEVSGDNDILAHIRTGDPSF